VNKRTSQTINFTIRRAILEIFRTFNYNMIIRCHENFMMISRTNDTCAHRQTDPTENVTITYSTLCCR